MGIFEKIFEVGNTMLDVMHACGSDGYADGVEMFVKTLSQTPNSQKQYANLLLQKAAEKPEILRFDGMGLGGLGVGCGGMVMNGLEGGMGDAVMDIAAPVPTRQWRGSIVGEIDDDGVYTGHEDATEESTGEVTWREDAVWISEGERDGSIELDDDAVGDVDIDIGDDRDWNFAIKMEA